LVLPELLLFAFGGFFDNASLFLFKVFYAIVEFLGVLKQFLLSFGYNVFP
jgi:hypothetical protein